MASCSLLMLWICSLTQACRAEELPREELLSWVRERLLGGLGLEEPPAASLQGLSREPPGSWPPPHRGRRAEHRPEQEAYQIFLFPSSASCSAPAETSYHFQPSINRRHSLLTSAHFWLYTGGGVTSNASAVLLLTPSGQQPLQAAAEQSSDGWSIFWLQQQLLPAVSAGPFLLQVICPSCGCPSEEHTPFLHLQAGPRAPSRSPRRVPTPWSPSALDLLQRPSPQRPLQGDCQRAEVQVSFQELGWDSWIVHPKVVTFYYCQGNCSAGSLLDITRCCAPVPGSMRSLQITTTSDGGYSFKHETLPNIMPEECTCF